MLFQDPGPSRGDLRFRVLGFPVRIHPFFWVMCVLLGGLRADPGVLFLWAAAVLVSTLVHELGHALVMRHYREQPEIVLHGTGGLAITHSRWRRTYDSQIHISLAGPAAGFALAALVAAVAAILGAEFSAGFSRFGIPYVRVDWAREALVSNRWGHFYIEYLFNSLLWVTIYWDLLNLFPVFPLDGGQALRAWLEKTRGYQGLIESHWITLVTGAAVAAMALFGRGGLWLALLFGMCAWSAWQALQQTGRAR